MHGWTFTFETKDCCIVGEFNNIIINMVSESIISCLFNVKRAGELTALRDTSADWPASSVRASLFKMNTTNVFPFLNKHMRLYSVKS